MVKSILLSLLFIALFIYLGANMYASLTISPLLTSIEQKDFEGVAGYLRSIKSMPEFDSEYGKYKTIFGDRLYASVYREDLAQLQEKKKLEQILLKNPNARDVLYRLYLQYTKEGNVTRGQEYLKRAQEIDPMVK